MSKAQDRRNAQHRREQEAQADQQARPNLPPTPSPPASSPDYCPQSRTGYHTWYTNATERTLGLRRCYHCTAKQLEDGRVIRLGDPAYYPAKVKKETD